MSKYEPLESYLRQSRRTEVALTFEEIEAIIGARLPPAAHAHRAWWSNNPSNNVMTKSWLAAGFVSERVDIPGQKLVFRRSSQPDSGRANVRAGGLLDRLKAALGGTVTVAPGLDLTSPTGEVWDAER